MTDKTSSWKPLDFQCRYACNYCPEKGHSIEPILREDWRDISWGRTGIWVCGDTDLFHPDVPNYIIEAVLERARDNPSQCYIFCTKNPQRYVDFLGKFPPWAYFTTTVESDIDYECGGAPPPLERLEAMKTLWKKLYDFPKLRPKLDYQLNIDMQPAFDFTPRFLKELTDLGPDQVCIGHRIPKTENNPVIPEPDFRKLMKLARKLSKCFVTKRRNVWTICLVNIDSRTVTPKSRFTSWPFIGFDC